MSSNNFAAVATAVQGIDEAALEALVSADGRGLSTNSGNAVGSAELASAAKQGMSKPHEYTEVNDRGQDNSKPKGDLDSQAQSAITDDHPALDGAGHISKPRNRRASDGAYLTKSDGKRVSSELRCEKCGKGYKHSSCLTKHLLVSHKPFRILSILPALP